MQAGVTAPIVLMGYYNPVINYGERELVRDAGTAGANGFIIVDCPPEEGINPPPPQFPPLYTFITT